MAGDSVAPRPRRLWPRARGRGQTLQNPLKTGATFIAREGAVSEGHAAQEVPHSIITLGDSLWSAALLVPHACHLTYQRDMNQDQASAAFATFSLVLARGTTLRRCILQHPLRSRNTGAGG